jgi:hypothetical protein
MDGYVVKYAGTGIATLFGQLSQTSDVRIEFIDPLCTIIKACILVFKKTGTKLSIKNNVIDIQEQWALQGMQRWFNCDERDQLHQLRLPILYFKGLHLGYVTADNLNIDAKSFDYFNALAIKGLVQLKTTYETAKKIGSMVKNCIDDYIKTLSHAYSREEYFKELETINKPTLFVIYDEFIKKWSDRDIGFVMSLFQYAQEKDNINIQNEIANAINHFIMSKDIEIDAIRPD